MTYIFVAILLFITFRFVTGFLWPVYKATREVKRHFETMKGNMPNQENGSMYTNVPENEKPKFDLGGEYIHYEEIKEK